MTNDFSRKYAVIDLEATGSGALASIIQVGIVIIKDQEIVDSYQTDINPHEPLSDHIKKLTGITDHQLSQAPDFSQVAKTIYELIEDCVFVAHNVKFDANLLAESLFFEGYELLTPRVDTVELAQVFYPSLEKYSLGHLSEQLQLELSDAHTAIADAKATAKLFIKLLQKIENLPRETLEAVLCYSGSLLFETEMIIREALSKSKPYNPQKHINLNGILLKKEKPALKPRQMSTDFAINTALLSLDERASQKAFVQFVEEGLDQSEPSFIQAQAGIGKTYGYLLPLLAHNKQTQVVVSVPTKILQDQIVANEVTAISEQFHLDCHSIKGPGNYIKLDLFQESLNQKDDNRLINRYKMQLLVWLFETSTGDLDEIKQKQRFAAYFDHIKHDGVLESTSIFYDYDFWRKSYEKAKTCRLLITNHAYFLHRVQDDKAFAKNKVLVFDEAQKLVLQLEQLSRQHIDLMALLRDLQQSINKPQSLLEKRLLEGIVFELSQLASDYYQKGIRPNEGSWTRLKEHVKELPDGDFTELKRLFQHQDDDYWISSEQQDEKRVTYLNVSRKSVTNLKTFLPETLKLYFVSATLHISPQVSLADLLGFDRFAYSEIDKQSHPNQLLFIDKEMPLVSDSTDQAYAQEIAERLLRLSKQPAPVLVLFTSKKQMLMVSDQLDSWQVSHLTQEKNGTPYSIKKRFDRGEQSMLLGLGAFWEGVDFVHADRMIAVITRLPFDNPEDVFVKKLSSHLLSQGKNPFNDYFLPMAILKLKQAIGRTMRRDNQKSAIILLDRRVITKSYGQVILDSLTNDFTVYQQNFEDSLEKINDFLT
ncbi:bifunctional DnaQ family exonuclease/ATP-dependent helicase [Streptococcus phocae]|uniref:3'-5' exonuclease DinG n=1 Tax=Streptococcus phocae TaxID=119224 RepID=A0A0P6S3G1_9STRE|nr:bifunctional DnaQ family exonuclease/ATP-dependent helicase [Streptococcus phocae]KPJ22649.1 ATP-dependent DNA helicase [Streptococcus phocae]